MLDLDRIMGAAAEDPAACVVFERFIGRLWSCCNWFGGGGRRSFLALRGTDALVWTSVMTRGRDGADVRELLWMPSRLGVVCELCGGALLSFSINSRFSRSCLSSNALSCSSTALC